jgi:hypothetical protein
MLVLRWIRGQSWGHQPWWTGVVEWFLFPAIFLLEFAILWLALRLILGSPRDTLKRVDWDVDTEIRPEKKGPANFHDRAWSGLFHLLIFRRDKKWPFPFGAYVAMAIFGTILALVAVLASLLPEFIYSGRSQLSFPVIMALVVLGMIQSRRTVRNQICEVEKKYERERASAKKTLEQSASSGRESVSPENNTSPSQTPDQQAESEEPS